MIYGHNHRTPQQTSKKRYDPFRGVLSPEQNRFSLPDVAGVQLSRNTICLLADLSVCPTLCAISATVPNRGFSTKSCIFRNELD
jgi:hypothetical protein